MIHWPRALNTRLIIGRVSSVQLVGLGPLIPGRAPPNSGKYWILLKSFLISGACLNWLRCPNCCILCGWIVAWQRVRDMADIKTLYAEVTRRKQAELDRVASEVSTHPRAADEERLFAKFRSRAREDFSTLHPAGSRR